MISLVLSLALLLVGCSPKPSPSAGLPLIVGMELNYHPFEMTDVSGKPSGLSVELAQKLADSLHRPLQIENISFDGLIPALLTKKIDLILSSLTVTPERSKVISFSQPYARIGLALLTRKDPTLLKADDLNRPDRTLVTKRGTSGHLVAERLFPKAKKLVVDKDAAAYLEISQGKADAFLYDQLSVARAHQRYPDSTQALLSSIQEENWALGLRSSDAVLLRQVNAFLESFHQQAGFQKLSSRYLAPEEALFRQAGIPFIFSSTP